MKKGKIFWLTGLSGSGKSTLAEIVKSYFDEKNITTKIIDGDVVRERYQKPLGFTKDDILKNNSNILEFCKEELEHSDIILVPVIAPYREFRDKAKTSLSPLLFEIYISANIETVISRDTKGLYKKAIAGEINNMIGYSKSNPYEEPKNPDFRIDSSNDKESVNQSAEKLCAFIEDKLK